MRIVCAPDSFKESMTALSAAEAMARGVRRVLPDADIVQLPMSDGGEGFLEALATAKDARRVSLSVSDALGRPLDAEFALADDGTAIIEMASAAGLEHIAPGDRDIWHSSTRGVGELVRAALDQGATQLVMGIGGSATNDAGAGMLAALGVRYLDADGRELDAVPATLRSVAAIDTAGLDPRLADVQVRVACDVTSPLCGPSGASAVFGPQKGADADDVPRLDALLGGLADLDDGRADADRPGAGAAGGLGYALVHHLHAELVPGIELVSDLVGLADAVEGADLVLTGEGSVDAQTLQGKTPAGVAKVASEHRVPIVVLAGRVAPDADVLLDHGVLALVPILPAVTSLEDALAQGAEDLERATATVCRLVFGVQGG